MLRSMVLCAFLLVATAGSGAAQPPTDASKWTFYITNDNCPDYTWGLTEEQTRQAFADVVKGHLDEMKRTDTQPDYSRNRYNMAVTQEALCFVERYPDRKEELIRRIQEGRVYVSPYLCNTLWGFQSAEGAIRAFYPARRLERQWHIPIGGAHHIELPSLPWGVPTILAGCGMRWLSVPYLKYDSTFGGLNCPPLFIHEGPDGSQVRVVMDRWASDKANYTQGAAVLRKPENIEKEWLPHYAGLGSQYPLRSILACGTHGDISPSKGAEAHGFAEAIINYNAQPDASAKLVNAVLPQFWQAVDEIQTKTPFLPVVRGDFGHSWDLWPVSLARYAAAMREGERRFLAAESLFAVADHDRADLWETTQADRQRAEWCWAMLGDHAWNGTDDNNKRHNAELRRKWGEELNQRAEDLLGRGWSAAGLEPATEDVTIFNSLSVPRTGLVCIPASSEPVLVFDQGTEVPSQTVSEDGRPMLCFIPKEVPGFGFRHAQLRSAAGPSVKSDKLAATPHSLESPCYRLTVDPLTGGISSLVQKLTGMELVTGGNGRSLCQTVYFDGEEHTLANARSELVAEGPVLARLRITGTVADAEVVNFVTVYADLDQVDFDLRIHKPATAKEHRLCQVFPVGANDAALHIASAGAVVRPRPQPEGDLLPGADPRRFAVQEFVSVSTSAANVTIVPLDAFALRLDLGPMSFEAIGNDQNYREVTRDQHGVTDFRFRYSLRARSGAYGNAEAIAFSRTAATPLQAAAGRLRARGSEAPAVTVDPARAIATCFKPADDGRGCILRLWETGGKSGPTRIALSGFQEALQTDLLERDLKELQIADRELSLDLPAHGYSAVRLLP